MFNTTKNSKNLSMLSIAFMLCIASLLVDCSSGGGSSGGGGTGPGSATCRNGLGAVGACESCDEGFRLEVGLCNPIPGAPCADGSGSAGACVSCNTGFVLTGGSCFAQVTVSFNLNGGIGGNSPSNQIIRAGESVTVPSLPAGITNGTLVFIGWSTLSTNVGANFVRAGNTYIIPAVRVPSATLTLYATWGQAYTVTYNLNGGMGSAPNVSVGLAGTEVTLRALTLTGSNNNNRPANASASPNNGFFGWGVDANGTGQTYNAETNQVFASTTTLYALWYYSISYHCGEGTASGSFPTRTTVRIGEVLTNLPLTGCSPNLADGSTFVGWSTTGNAPYIITMPNGPITLRAVYVVDVDADGLIEISTAEQLNNMRYNLAGTSWKTSASATGVTSGCPVSGCRGYELVADIDLGNTKWGTSASFVGTRVAEGWEPIGACSSDADCTDATDTPFTATFEGRGFVIRNLYINKPSITTTETGLFGAISVGTLNQVALESTVVWGSAYTGALVGYQNSGTISNSYATGSVMGSGDYTGGLVGGTDGGTIGSSYATGVVTGNNSTGGLVGVQRDSIISNSYATGAVTGSGNTTGGLVGLIFFGSRTRNSYATGAVTGSGDNTGGLAGSVYGIIISNSYATGSVRGTSNVGGLVGLFASDMRNSYATGAVTGSGDNTGGLVGQNTANISNSYATGSVRGSGDDTGGLVGQNTGTLSNSYATGLVMGTAGTTGGLIGAQTGGSTTNSFWDSVRSAQLTSAGGAGVTGLNTSEMKVACTNYETGICSLGSRFAFDGRGYPRIHKGASLTVGTKNFVAVLPDATIASELTGQATLIVNGTATTHATITVGGKTFVSESKEATTITDLAVSNIVHGRGGLVGPIEVTNNGATAYRFSGFASENPSLVMLAGEQLIFELNVVGHPFTIRVSAEGANYNTGLSHISPTNVITEGSAAQAMTSGFTYLNLPLTPITIAYRCGVPAHASMTGSIIVK